MLCKKSNLSPWCHPNQLLTSFISWTTIWSYLVCLILVSGTVSSHKAVNSGGWGGGLSWWFSGTETTCHCRRHGFGPRSARPNSSPQNFGARRHWSPDCRRSGVFLCAKRQVPWPSTAPSRLQAVWPSLPTASAAWGRRLPGSGQPLLFL